MGLAAEGIFGQAPIFYRGMCRSVAYGFANQQALRYFDVSADDAASFEPDLAQLL